MLLCEIETTFKNNNTVLGLQLNARNPGCNVSYELRMIHALASDVAKQAGVSLINREQRCYPGSLQMKRACYFIPVHPDVSSELSVKKKNVNIKAALRPEVQPRPA